MNSEFFYCFLLGSTQFVNSIVSLAISLMRGFQAEDFVFTERSSDLICSHRVRNFFNYKKVTFKKSQVHANTPRQ